MIAPATTGQPRTKTPLLDFLSEHPILTTLKTSDILSATLIDAFAGLVALSTRATPAPSANVSEDPTFAANVVKVLALLIGSKKTRTLELAEVALSGSPRTPEVRALVGEAARAGMRIELH